MKKRKTKLKGKKESATKQNEEYIKNKQIFSPNTADFNIEKIDRELFYQYYLSYMWMGPGVTITGVFLMMLVLTFALNIFVGKVLSIAPTKSPSARPSTKPSIFPTRTPTQSVGPTISRSPVRSNTQNPSPRPSLMPSTFPSSLPTTHPSVSPTNFASNVFDLIAFLLELWDGFFGEIACPNGVC